MAKVHPVFIIGVIVMVLPFALNGVLRTNIPSWIAGVGLVIMLIGFLISVFD